MTASPPVKDLYKFEGTIDMPNGKKPQELKLVNFLHRGSILKNSIKIDAMVVYTGHASKLALNVSTPRTKRTRAKAVFDVLVVLYVLITIASMAIYLW